MEQKRKKVLIAGGLILFVIIIIGIFAVNYVISNRLDNFSFEVIAENIEKGEILTDTNFIIKAEKDYSVNLLKKIVNIQPEVDYSLEKTSRGTYLITPKENLADASIYNLYINVAQNKPALSWAFQTKEEFKVTSTLPFENRTYVETNTAIEINFSKQIDNIDSYFEIVPKVDGSFKYSGKKVTFVPNELLEKDTIYKVTVKNGVKSSFNDILKEDYAFSFRTETDIPYLYLSNGYQETIKPTDIPKILMSGEDVYKTALFTLKAYKLNSVEEYTSYLENHYNNIDSSIGKEYDHNFDMSKHFEVFNYETVLTNGENSWQDELILPDKLPVGWYIIDITNSLNNIRLQKALQVSDISVYTYGLNGDIRVWLNDSVSGGSLKGATVQIGDLAAISNKDGIAQFNISSSDRQKLIITTKDGRDFGEYIRLTALEESNLDDDYYMYLYTDRKQYLPTDTINYWGVIIPRKTNVDMPEEIEVISSDLKDVVKVNEHGTFIGSFNIVNHESSWMGIGLKLGERERVYLNEFSISDYIKPVYKISSDFTKDYYRKGENIELNVFGKFYDGTSAENVKVKVIEGNDEYKTVTLNSNGESRTVLNTPEDNSSGGISHIGVTLKVTGIDEESEYSYSYNSIPYFPTDYYIGAEWNTEDKQAIFTANKINYNAVDNNGIDYNEIYEGEAFSQDISLELVEYWTEKRYTGETEYDAYSGTFEPKYTYHNRENIIDTYNVTIPKGEALIVDMPRVGENETVSYKIRMHYKYPDGFIGMKELYAWTESYYPSEYYVFNADNYELKENETTKIKLTGKENKNGRMLYIVSTDKINKLGVTNTDSLEVKMTKELIPNCLVSGAFFDGKYVYEIYNEYLRFDSDERELSIEIKSDKETYSPGDEVNVTARVTDVNNKPVQSSLLLSVVDEAALFDYYEEWILDEIYHSRYHEPITFNSDTNKEYGGEGGGGGDEIRDTFTDVLAFENIYTDKNGEASISFNMSDDLTSWRITGVAISDDVKAGKTKKNIKTTIPFFINQVISKKYTVKDDVSFSVRVAGTATSLISSNVSYEVKLLTDDDKVVKSEVREAKPLAPVMFNFGKLEAGKYKTQVIAKAGAHKDGIEKEFEVIESLHEISLTKEIDASEIETLDAVRYPVRLILFDKNNGLYYNSLKKILEKSNGGTNEQAVARNYVHKKLNAFYGEEFYDEEFTTLLQEYGGALKLPSGGADALFTAQVVANTNGYLNTKSAENYFYNIIEDDKSISSEVTAAYMGLAALKKPVLTDIKYLLENDDGLEIYDKINLINALVYIGDYSSALRYYEKEIEPIMKLENEVKYISSEHVSLNYQATSRILPMLALINHNDFEKVLKYVLENDTKEYIPVMDLMTFINSYEPTTECNSKLTYTLAGEEIKVDFSKEKIKILELNKAQFDTFKLNKIKGEVKAIAEYIGSIEEIENLDGNIKKVNTMSNLKDALTQGKNNKENIKITKTISNGELGEYSTVALNVKLPVGDTASYVVDDIIPTSSRYVALVNNSYSSPWSLIKQEGQRIKFFIRPKESNNITITYKIRNVFSGEFGVEPACITNNAGKVFGLDNNNLLTFTVK